MKVVVDEMQVREFAQRTIPLKGLRQYCTVQGYNCLVLVFHGLSYGEWLDKQQEGVALFNFDTVDGRIICDQFPSAPAHWREHKDLVQCTVKKVRFLPPGQAAPLSQAIEQHLGPGC